MRGTGVSGDPRERLIVALDLPRWNDAEQVVRLLDEEILWYKVGLQLFTAEGPEAVRRLVGMGKKVFLDLKLHDIPSTVEKAVASAAGIGAGLLTLHAVSDPEALSRASKAARAGDGRLRLLGVTVLTSSGGMSEEELAAEVLRRADVAAESGLDGVVAPATTLGVLADRFGSRLPALCPGIRPKGAAPQDQRWVMTPGEAVGAGARWIVVGRPIVQADNPREAATSIRREISEAVGG